MNIALFLNKQIAPPPPISYTKPLLVFLSGQSNAVGANTNTLVSIGRPELTEVIPNAYAWQSSSFAPLQILTTNGGSTMGCETELGYQFPIATGQPIYFCKYAVSGTPIYMGIGSDWNISSVGEYYDTMKSKALAAIAGMNTLFGAGNWDFGCLIWMQGESDASPAERVAAYKVNTFNLWSDFRNIIGHPIKVINPRVRSSWGAGKIVALQRELDNDLSYVKGFETDDCENDGTHYTCAGQITISNRILNLMTTT
jgi:hypothetical protein